MVSEEEGPFSDTNETVTHKYPIWLHHQVALQEYTTGKDALPFEWEDWDENWINNFNDNPDSNNDDVEEVEYD